MIELGWSSGFWREFSTFGRILHRFPCCHRLPDSKNIPWITMGMQAIFGGLRLTTSIFYLYIYIYIYIFITLVLRLDSRGLYNDVYNIYIYIDCHRGWYPDRDHCRNMTPRSTPSCRAFGVYQVDFEAIAWHISLILPMTHDGDFPVMIRYDSLMEGRWCRWCRWKPAKPPLSCFWSIPHSKKNQQMTKICASSWIRSSDDRTWQQIAILDILRRFGAKLWDSSIIQWELFPTIQDPTRKIVIEPWTSSSNREKTHEESVKITINFLIHWTSIQTSIQTSHVSQFFHGHNMAVTIAGDHRLISACAQRLCGLGDGGFHHGHQIPEASTVPEPFMVFFLKTNGWVHGEDSCTGTSHHKRHFFSMFSVGKSFPRSPCSQWKPTWIIWPWSRRCVVVTIPPHN